MVRIILFLFLVGAVALGFAIAADQGGDVSLQWGAWKADPPALVVVLCLVLTVFILIFAWSLVRGLWRVPRRIREAHHARRQARGRHAITQGLIAIGTGDHFAARHHADVARRLAHQDPLALLLHAQAAQLNGDREGAQRAFHTLAEREDTRVLGLRGLFVEAQRRDDPFTAVAMAEEALKAAPASAWASHAVLGFRCSRGDWDGALEILENDLASGLIDTLPYRRQRGVLLTARALHLEAADRYKSRESVMEAVKLAPTLVPAVALAAKFLSESNQTRRAMHVVEVAWVAQPHPDLADAYAHIRLGDSAVQRLARVESLSAKSPGHIEGALAVARAAIDASEFQKARDVLQSFTDAPTQRVALLMAELERAEHGDSGSARAWMLRAVRATHDPVWTADGYVSDRWRPVSPVSGRLDAFQWLTPLAALPSDKSNSIDAEIANDPMLAPPQAKLPAASEASQDNLPATSAARLETSQIVTSPQAAPIVPPVFRPRREIEKIDSARLPPVIPIIRAPDDPGVADDTPPDDEFTDSASPERMQAGGWRGFLARLVS